MAGTGMAITGAGGFVGRRLVRHFARKGWRVFALTSDPSRVLRAERVTAIRCDWSPQGLAAALGQAREASVWVHAAARVDFGSGNEVELYEANTVLSGCLARLFDSETTGARLVYLSTVSVYGNPQTPSLEIAPRPDTAYGTSKLLGERLCQAFLGTRCLVLRLAGVWGLEERPKLFVNRCIGEALQGRDIAIRGPGLGKRNYVWAGDLPAWVERGVSEEWSGVRLVASPYTYTLMELGKIVADRFGVELRIGEPRDPAPEHDVIVPVPPGVPGTDFRAALALEAETR